MQEYENNSINNINGEYSAGENNMNGARMPEFNNTEDINAAAFNNTNSSMQYNMNGMNMGRPSDLNSGLNNEAFNNANGQNINNFNSTNGMTGEEHNRMINEKILKELHEKNKIKYEERRLKRQRFKMKIVASLLAVAICSTGIGLGISVGNGMMNKIGIGNNTAKDFSFNEDKVVIQNTEEAAETVSTNTIAPIIKNVKDAVVNINVIVERRDFFNMPYQNQGSGSGIIYKEDSEKIYIITNNHVVDGANKVTISITGDEQISASLVGKDAQSDLAVIYVLRSDLEKAGITSVSVAKFADSSYIEVGEYVIAIGNALGAGKTVTQGIISAQNKNITIDGKKLTVLQTDAAINPGNSGGALVNTDGEVIGINTAKISSTTIEGMGYAIPSSIAVSIANELIANGSIERPYLGVEVFTITEAFKAMYNIDYNGVFIRAVNSGSTAEEAGLKSTDIITGFNGKEITTVDDLSEAINGCKANQEVVLSIIRNGIEPMNITVRLAVAEKNF